MKNMYIECGPVRQAGAVCQTGMYGPGLGVVGVGGAAGLHGGLADPLLKGTPLLAALPPHHLLPHPHPPPHPHFHPHHQEHVVSLWAGCFNMPLSLLCYSYPAFVSMEYPVL